MRLSRPALTFVVCACLLIQLALINVTAQSNAIRPDAPTGKGTVAIKAGRLIDGIAGTINAATLLGWEKRIGSLEVEKYADIVAVNGGPLADVKRVESVVFVMKNGVVYKPALRREGIFDFLEPFDSVKGRQAPIE